MPDSRVLRLLSLITGIHALLLSVNFDTKSPSERDLTHRCRRNKITGSDFKAVLRYPLTFGWCIMGALTSSCRLPQMVWSATQREEWRMLLIIQISLCNAEYRWQSKEFACFACLSFLFDFSVRLALNKTVFLFVLSEKKSGDVNLMVKI